MKQFTVTTLFLVISWLAYSQTTTSITIHFENNSYELVQSEKERIRALITEQTIEQIQLSGHTDNVGSIEANLALSQNRDEQVHFHY